MSYQTTPARTAAVSPVDPTLVRLVGYLALFWPTVGYYVYDDSRRRGHARPLARGVLIGALGIVGVFVHLRTRNDRPD